MATQSEGEIVVETKVDAFRLAGLNEVWALRNWSLGHWFESLRQKGMAFEYMSSIQQYEIPGAALAIKYYIFSTHYSKNLKSALTLTSRLEHAETSVKVMLIRQILPLRAYAANSVRKFLTDLSDAIPQECMEDVVRWFIGNIDARGKDDLIGDPYAAISMWKDIIGNTFCDTELCNSLVPVFLPAVRLPASFSGESAFAIYNLFCFASRVDFDRLLESALDDCEFRMHLEFRLKWRVMYCIFADKYRDSTRLRCWLEETAVDDTDRRLLTLFLDDSLGATLEKSIETKKWAKSRIEAFLDVITDASRTEFGSGPGFSAELVEKLDWLPEDAPLFERLLSAVYAERITINEVPYCFELARSMLRKNPSAFGQLGLEYLVKYLRDQPKVQGYFFFAEHLNSGSDMVWENLSALLALLVDVYKAESIPQLTYWLTENYLEVPVAAAGWILRAAVIVGCESQERGEADHGGFTLHEELWIATVLLERCLAASDSEEPSSKGLIGYLDQVRDLFQYSTPGKFSLTDHPGIIRDAICGVLAKRMSSVVHHRDANVRAAVARVLAVWKSNTPDALHSIDNWIEQLSRDPRGRVRKAMLYGHGSVV